MYDRERERELWNQSGARYRVKEGEQYRTDGGERKQREADNFEADAAPKSRKKLPLHLAALENEYGNVEFARQEDGSLTVSFAKKQEFREPVFMKDAERIYVGHSTETRVGGMMRIQNNGSENGAEAFVLDRKKNHGRQMNQILKIASGPLEQMARSMASLLVPVSQPVVAQEQRELIFQDLVRTARRTAEKSGEKMEDEEKVQKEEMWTFRAVRKDDGEGAGGNGEDGREDKPPQEPEEPGQGARENRKKM